MTDIKKPPFCEKGPEGHPRAVQNFKKLFSRHYSYGRSDVENNFKLHKISKGPATLSIDRSFSNELLECPGVECQKGCSSFKRGGRGISIIALVSANSNSLAVTGGSFPKERNVIIVPLWAKGIQSGVAIRILSDEHCLINSRKKPLACQW